MEFFCFSGALIGEEADIFRHCGSLAGTPYSVYCSTHDPYIPLPRVAQSIQKLTAMKGVVTSYISTGASHTIREEDRTNLRNVITTLTVA